jgi:hypothetical protein
MKKSELIKIIKEEVESVILELGAPPVMAFNTGAATDLGKMRNHNLKTLMNMKKAMGHEWQYIEIESSDFMLPPGKTFKEFFRVLNKAFLNTERYGADEKFMARVSNSPLTLSGTGANAIIASKEKLDFNFILSGVVKALNTLGARLDYVDASRAIDRGEEIEQVPGPDSTIGTRGPVKFTPDVDLRKK